MRRVSRLPRVRAAALLSGDVATALRLLRTSGGRLAGTAPSVSSTRSPSPGPSGSAGPSPRSVRRRWPPRAPGRPRCPVLPPARRARPRPRHARLPHGPLGLRRRRHGRPGRGPARPLSVDLTAEGPTS
ncbi:hypothetical protein O1L60_14455 [Streptomyces diastatochromogenes]|nr:hypothetical protein [Streptomyces diastatochromogenes]